MLTTIDEEVLELWTRRVTSIPITRPAKGFESTLFSWKMSPAAFPEKTHILVTHNKFGNFVVLKHGPLKTRKVDLA